MRARVCSTGGELIWNDLVKSAGSFRVVLDRRTSRPASRPPSKVGPRSRPGIPHRVSNSEGEAASVVAEAAIATVDHPDIRGSEPHNRDPSGAASDYRRGSSPKARRIESSRILLSVPLDHHRCCLLHVVALCDWCYAATDLLLLRPSVSTCRPIAQMNPSSSRPTAVTTSCLHLPRASRWQ
jgi:hypothetical protein